MITERFLNVIWIFFEANLSVRTRKEYFNVIKDFDKCVGHDPLLLRELDANKYYNYLLNRVEEKRLSYTTALMRLSVIRSVCDFIRTNYENHGKQYTNYFSSMRLPDIDKTITSDDLPNESELNELLSIALENNDNKAFLIFSLIISCAITSSELCQIRVEDIVIDKYNNLCIKIYSGGKYKKSRIIKLPSSIANNLNEFISLNEIYSGPIFLNKRKNRMKLRDAQRILNKYLEIGMKNQRINKHFTFQTLRHCALLYMIKGGASTNQVSEYAGITTKWINRYKHLPDSERVSDAVDYSIISLKKIRIKQME